MKVTRATAVALIAGVLAVSAAPAPDAKASSPADTLGVYTGARDISGANEFGSWLGRPVTQSLDFLDGSTWSSIEAPTWFTSGWGSSSYRTDYSVPMFPNSGGSLTTGASGGYNSHFVKLGQNLVANGEADAIVRPGWEFNGNWFSWACAPNPSAWAGYFRQIVTAMRSVPGQHFVFEWNPTNGRASVNPELCYPGDAYVDRIGSDVYDNRWGVNSSDPAVRWNHALTQPNGLNWLRQFAAAHGKPEAYPEWGVWDYGSMGGGDAPYFVQAFHDWIWQGNVAAHYYFNAGAPDGDHRLTGSGFPQSAEKFRQLFGTSAPPPPPPPNPGQNQAPTVNLLRPTNGQVFTKRLTITAQASDDRRGERVEILVDGRRVATEYESPYSINLRTKRLSYGRHTVTAKAYDAAGLSASTSASVTRVRYLGASSASRRLAKVRAIRRAA